MNSTVHTHTGVCKFRLSCRCTCYICSKVPYVFVLEWTRLWDVNLAVTISMDILVRNKVCPMFLILYAKTIYAIPTKLTCKKAMQILIGSRNILRNQCRQLGCLIYDISLLRSICGCYHIACWWFPLPGSSNSLGHRSFS